MRYCEAISTASALSSGVKSIRTSTVSPCRSKGAGLLGNGCVGPRRTHRVNRAVISLSDGHLEELNTRIDELHDWLGEVNDSQAPHRIAMIIATCDVLLKGARG